MIRRLTLAAVMLPLLMILSGCGASGSGHDLTTPEQTFKSATLRWAPPSSDANGSQLADLAGFRVYMGQKSKEYTRFIDVGESTTASIDKLTEGRWCFSVTAYDTSGNESSFSNEICAVI